MPEYDSGGRGRPDWLPDAYDPDAPLADRLRIMADLGAVELHVQGSNGVIEIVGRPKGLTESRHVVSLDCGQSSADDEWEWEIVVPDSDEHPSRLTKVNPLQLPDAYEATKRTWLRDVDVRMYGIDAYRFDDAEVSTSDE